MLVLFQRFTQGPLWSVAFPKLTQLPNSHVWKPLDSGRMGHLMCSILGGLQPHITSWMGATLTVTALGYSTPEI